jgi:hypothetical protein
MKIFRGIFSLSNNFASTSVEAKRYRVFTIIMRPRAGYNLLYHRRNEDILELKEDLFK